jgi:hypothetical protein
MRLYRLTVATILQRKVWVIMSLVVVGLPFALPLLSSATEKPLLVQPARILAAWGALWFGTLVWGLYTAAQQGESNVRSGRGEYFLTTGVGSSRQLFELWLAIFSFVAPLALATAAICQFAASPSDPTELAGWWWLNLQYLSLFLLVVSPLLALAIALASRFGSAAAFSLTFGLAAYGLWGTGYIQNLIQVEENPVLQSLLLISPQYRFADLTQRLHFKFGPLSGTAFWQSGLYFAGILAIYSGISRLCFRCSNS